jgi:glycosyltransferase involved in cell wall biosynthesis
MAAKVSVVVPAYNAESTIGRVLAAIAEQEPRPHEVIVVDDGSTDGTAAVAERLGARVVRADGEGYAGGARNTGWSATTGDVVVFIDADVVPDPGWAEGLSRALTEFPGAIVGCARTFSPRTPWDWVAHLQCETPYLPQGEPRQVQFLSSYCMAVPRAAPLRWDESYGGEDGIFCADALAAGFTLVFDPRFHARHDHERETFSALRAQQRRMAYSIARFGPVQREGLHKRVFSRVPLHYFALVRLVLIYRRVRGDERLRKAFLRQLPRLVVAEWTLGASAVRHAIRRPPLRGQGAQRFRAGVTGTQ